MWKKARQIINLLLVDNFYFSDVITDEFRIKATNRCVWCWSLVMVRNPQLPAQVIDATTLDSVAIACYLHFQRYHGLCYTRVTVYICTRDSRKVSFCMLTTFTWMTCKIAIFSQFQVYWNRVKQMINLLLLSNFYPVIYQWIQREDELLYTSLVMVRELAQEV